MIFKRMLLWLRVSSALAFLMLCVSHVSRITNKRATLLLKENTQQG